MKRFSGNPKVEVLPNPAGVKSYKLLEELVYRSDIPGPDVIVRIEEGFVSDGATVPRFFWRWFPPTGQYTAAAILHDWLCVYRIYSHKISHRMFNEAMKDLNVPSIIRRPMFWGVWMFGPKW